MDDIRVYSYEKEEMENLIVNLDILMERKGLSLNPNKTSIKELNNDEIIDSDIIFDYVEETDDVELEFQSLSIQDGLENNDSLSSSIDTITAINQLSFTSFLL